MKTRLALQLLTIALLAGVTLSGCASTRPISDQFEDGTITTKVKSKLAGDPDINPFNIDVDTLDGVVTLRGEVEKERARDEAQHHAENTRGVKQVINEIRVVSAAYEDDERYSDVWITTKITTKYTADPQLNPFNIDVDTQDGHVTLSGRVKTENARNEAEKLANDTAGVMSVSNQLEVEAP